MAIPASAISSALGVTAAGLPQRCVFHGLRKAACRRLAEAACTVHEIAAISGHASLREVERYTKAVEQVGLAKKVSAKTAAQENKSGYGVSNPDPTEVSNPLKVLAQ
jgi:integrase